VVAVMLERYIVFSNLFFGFDRAARKSGGARERLSLLCEGWGGVIKKLEFTSVGKA